MQFLPPPPTPRSCQNQGHRRRIFQKQNVQYLASYPVWQQVLLLFFGCKKKLKKTQLIRNYWKKLDASLGHCIICIADICHWLILFRVILSDILIYGLAVSKLSCNIYPYGATFPFQVDGWEFLVFFCLFYAPPFEEFRMVERASSVTPFRSSLPGVSNLCLSFSGGDIPVLWTYF